MLILCGAPTAFGASDFDLRLIRTYATNEFISGELLVNGHFLCHTLERPWSLDNDVISAIPEGSYGVFLHYKSPDAQHAATGIYWRMELNWVDTKPRTAIQIHIGNTVDDTVGCILPGLATVNSEARVELSAGAISALEREFYGTSTPKMTPDKKVSLNISSLKRPTELLVTDAAGTSILRQDGLRWMLDVDGKVTHMYDEIKRTEKYFLFSGAPSTFAHGRKVRIGLHGGVVELSKDGKKWRVFNEESVVKRVDDVMKFLAPI
ncbi:DUF5675 family protein [Mesorhizobium sp.]|uniref:DUF5675 family protein n=1 Tax=Mesorhizobium sp. TaxID=1871066 RepID=UPI00122BE0AC|nr:DUF5675 family protein [Mesorhizobium sp.]TIN22883.1 MAG: hypothetical protein E5Y19_30145 [Mesorhizobium sp.]